MRCEEIMKRDVQCLRQGDTVQEAAKKMREENIGFMPICENGTKVLGTLTDRDIAVRVVAENRSPATTKVDEVMSREVIACNPKDDLRKAEQLMAQHHKSRILVLENGARLVGVISLSDIAQREEAGRASEVLKQVTAREAAPGLA